VKEEEETLGQLRDRQVLASAPASVPGPRAAFVHIEVQDGTSGKDTDGAGAGEGGQVATGGESSVEVKKVKEKGAEEAGEVEEEQAAEGEAEPSNQRAHAHGTSLTGGSDTVRPRRLPRAPVRYADSAVQDNNDDDEEKETLFPELVMRGGGGHVGSSRFQGVSWAANRLKWKSECMGTFLGYHTTEEAAARVQQVPQGRHCSRTSGARRMGCLSVEGRQLEQAQQEMEGGMQREIPGRSRDGGGRGEGIQQIH
jgi:hypothetical protein